MVFLSAVSAREERILDFKTRASRGSGNVLGAMMVAFVVGGEDEERWGIRMEARRFSEICVCVSLLKKGF